MRGVCLVVAYSVRVLLRSGPPSLIIIIMENLNYSNQCSGEETSHDDDDDKTEFLIKTHLK